MLYNQIKKVISWKRINIMIEIYYSSYRDIINIYRKPRKPEIEMAFKTLIYNKVQSN